jgi:hypothetical protein
MFLCITTSSVHLNNGQLRFNAAASRLSLNVTSSVFERVLFVFLLSQALNILTKSD